MKIIDKVLQSSKYTAEDIITWNCPSHYGFEDLVDCLGYKNCKKCWDREIEEPKKKAEQIENNVFEQLTARIGQNMKDMINSLLKEETTKSNLRPTTHSDKLNLQNDDLMQMAKKLNEEVGEVIEAVGIFNADYSWETRGRVAQEALDVMQVALNIIYYLTSKHWLRFDIEVVDHNNKLIDRGWEFDNSLSLKIINNEVEE